MTANVRGNSQRGVLTRCGPLASKKCDENTPFSASYACVNKYLATSSKNPVRMVLTCGQTVSRRSFSVCVDEISRETALELADSKYFEAAFDLADNRKALQKACQQARQFYIEHVLQKNPFPPKQKFRFDMGKKAKRESTEQPVSEEPVKSSDSNLSLNGSMSLTSLSSHNLLATPSLKLKSPKKQSIRAQSAPPLPNRHSHQIPKLLETPPIPVPHPPSQQKKPTEENRLMNTFYTSE